MRREVKPYSQFGDVHSYDKRSGLFQRGLRLLKAEQRERILSVRYRPDGKGANEYQEGVLTVWFRRPEQTLGPYPYRTTRLKSGEYFELTKD